MKADKLIKLGALTAILSFITGTTLFISYYYSSSVELAIIAYIFILLIGFFNLIVLVFLVVKSIRDRSNRRKIVRIIFLMLGNIPVAFVYIVCVAFLLNIMRITFINETNKSLTEINVIGCENKTIDILEPNESVTSWIEIHGDCYITIKYILEGQSFTEEVVGYVSSSMGQRLTYRIGTDKGPVELAF